MKYIIIATLIAGCSTSFERTPQKQEEFLPKKPLILRRSRCPDRVIVKHGVEPWSDYDRDLIPGMNDGCKRHYSSAHCAIEIIKTSIQEYSIICGLVERSNDD